MVTNNFRKVLSALLYAGNTRTYGPEITDASGNSKHFYKLYNYGWPNQGPVNLSLSNTAAGIQIGSGSTPASANDHALESLITSGVSATVTLNKQVDGDGNYESAYLVTVTNNGSADVVVSEIGYVVYLLGATNNGSSSQAIYVLFDRTLLNTPVTIAPGESATITYTMKAVTSE